MSKPRSKKYSKEAKENDMVNITFSSDLGALEASVFNTVIPSPTQSDIDILRDELKAQQELMDNRLDAIEDQIFFVRRDEILEEDYKELKAAWAAYNTLMEKLKTFKRLKDSA